MLGVSVPSRQYATIWACARCDICFHDFHASWTLDNPHRTRTRGTSFFGGTGGAS